MTASMTLHNESGQPSSYNTTRSSSSLHPSSSSPRSPSPYSVPPLNPPPSHPSPEYKGHAIGHTSARSRTNTSRSTTPRFTVPEPTIDPVSKFAFSINYPRTLSRHPSQEPFHSSAESMNAASSSLEPSAADRMEEYDVSSSKPGFSYNESDTQSSIPLASTSTPLSARSMKQEHNKTLSPITFNPIFIPRSLKDTHDFDPAETASQSTFSMNKSRPPSSVSSKYGASLSTAPLKTPTPSRPGSSMTANSSCRSRPSIQKVDLTRLAERYRDSRTESIEGRSDRTSHRGKGSSREETDSFLPLEDETVDQYVDDSQSDFRVIMQQKASPRSHLHGYKKSYTSQSSKKRLTKGNFSDSPFLNKSLISNKNVHSFLKEPEEIAATHVLDFEGCLWLRNEVLQNIGYHCHHLRQLNLQNCIKLEDSALKTIGNGCKLLSYLNIGMCTNISDEGLINVFQNCNHLNDLRCHSCEKITGKSFAYLDKTSSLETVDISYTRINDEGLTNLGKHAPHLRYLNLSGCFYFGDEGLNELPLERMETLILSLCDQSILTSEYINKLIQKENGTELIHLDLSGMPQVQDALLERIALFCPNLEVLLLNGCFEITDKGLGHIAKQCHHLKTLNLSGCPKISLSGMTSLLANLTNSLETLAVNNCPLDETEKQTLWEKSKRCRIVMNPPKQEQHRVVVYTEINRAKKGKKGKKKSKKKK
eukprot:gb/GECH01001992.1/.p1 GENE.gb/GECH01001992.1/~~gb/GECH01001992.1/.p1  ORF type:complete len:706 (+),score=133.45 gb/GECH01001992.1/:1-2118(+)